MIAKNPAAALWASVALVTTVFLFVTAAIALESPAAAPAAGGAGAAAGAAAGEAAGEQRVDFVLTEFAMDPSAATVAAGAPLTLAGRNEGAVEHDVTIDDVGTSGAIPSGDEGELEVDGLEPGEYLVYCSIPGHRETGMEATLTVAEGADAVAAAGGDAAPVAGDEAHGAGDHAGLSPEEMVRGHEEGIAAFPAETEGSGNQPLEPEIAADGTKVFRLTADEVDWEVAPGDVKPAMAYNGQVPGPRIDVDLGDRIRVELDNQLEVPTAVHFHGLEVPIEQDGVPGITQDPVMPGDSYTYEFTVENAGSHMYHSHFDSATQVTSGLLGALVVHDPAETPVDQDTVMVLNDGPLGFTINGKGFPATAPIVATLGETVRIRYMNEGLQIHPMHLHGIPQRVVARDGYPLPQPYMADTVTVAPGERIDVEVEADALGTWAYHCHILNHAEGAEGMFGMVTALVVQE